MNFIYPSAAEMSEIQPELESKALADRVGLKIFPRVNKRTFFVRWIQRDNYFGLQQMRGLDGMPPKVTLVGSNTFVYEPGVYGEFVTITEREMLTRAVPGRPDIAVPISDLVMAANDQLLGRELDGQEYNVWTLLGTGSLTRTMPGPAGIVSYTDTYTTQTYTASVLWASASTATPLANFQSVQQLGLGHGTDFGAGATAYMNQVTANLLLNNSNASDFGGRRDQFGATLNNITSFNNYFQGQNLPKIQIVDDGFQPNILSGPETNPAIQFQKFIADHKVIVIGKRPGNANVGEYQLTINSFNGPGPGSYQIVKNFAEGINAPIEVPPRIECHRGHNGGPALFYPGSIVVMTV